MGFWDNVADNMDNSIYKLNQVNADLKDSQDKVAKQVSEISALEAKLTNSKNTEADLTQELNIKTKLVSSKNVKINDLQRQLKNSNLSLTHLQNELTMKDRSVLKHKSKIQDLKQQLNKQTEDYTIKTNCLTSQIKHMEKVKDTQLQELKEKFNNLKRSKEDLSQTTTQLESLQSKLDQTTAENNSHIQDITSQLASIKEENSTLLANAEYEKSIEKEFSYIVHIHDTYQQEIHPLVSDIFTFPNMENDPINTYIHLIHKRNIDKLWEHVREQLIDNPQDSQSKQIQDFLYALMERFFYMNPQYTFLKDEKSQQFTSFNHEIHPESMAQIGVVSRVILHGYINKNTKNIMKKSLVMLQ